MGVVGTLSVASVALVGTVWVAALLLAPFDYSYVVTELTRTIGRDDPIAVTVMLAAMLGAWGGPLYVLLVGPTVALMLRRALSRQREFLADAEAVLLTRDPEGLALALMKIGVATGALRGGDIIGHMFIVEPFGSRMPLLYRLFPTHPPIEERVELLAREGQGIDPAVIRRAVQVGEQDRATPPGNEPLPAAQEEACGRGEARGNAAAAMRPTAAGAAAHETQGLMVLYERPDGWSRVVAQLQGDMPLTRVNKNEHGNFVEVRAPDGLTGYVSVLAAKHVLAGRQAGADVEPQTRTV